MKQEYLTILIIGAELQIREYIQLLRLFLSVMYKCK